MRSISSARRRCISASAGGSSSNEAVPCSTFLSAADGEYYLRETSAPVLITTQALFARLEPSLAGAPAADHLDRADFLAGQVVMKPLDPAGGADGVEAAGLAAAAGKDRITDDGAVAPFTGKAARALNEASVDNQRPADTRAERAAMGFYAELAAAKAKGVNFIGPNTLGIASPGQGVVGMIGGRAESAREWFKPPLPGGTGKRVTMTSG